MSENYREIAKKLGVRHLFGRWGIRFYSQIPEGDKHWRIRIVPLDGWTTDPHEIVEAMANDPAFSIKYGDKK